MKEIMLQGSTFQSDETLLLNHSNIRIAEGASLHLTSGFSPDGILLEEKIPLSEHQAVFNFCLKGKQSFTLTGNYLPTAANPSHSNMLLLPNETFTARTESQGEFVTATLYISLSKFLSILGDSIEMLPKNFLNATEKNNVCYFKNHTWHPRIKQVVAQMQQHQFSPFAARIFLESKMLEIIAIMLELQHRAAESPQFIPKKDEEKIRYAREILEQDLANPPTLAHLARLIGSNEFTLKKGFKAIFGTPVYRFLQQLRMERAAELLQTTSLQVSEVALSVGYENVSAFTRAFREVYGALPSTMRKTPFPHN